MTIAIVGKYTGMKDAYKSLIEALSHGGISNKVKVKLDWIESEVFENEDPAPFLRHRLVEIGQAVAATEEHFISADQQPGDRIGWQRFSGPAAKPETHESLNGAGVHGAFLLLSRVSDCDESSVKVAALQAVH